MIPISQPISPHGYGRSICQPGWRKNSPTELDKSTQALLPPMGLKGMAQALALLETALRQQQRVLIVGDFDADGATSSALSVLALRAMGCPAGGFSGAQSF